MKRTLFTLIVLLPVMILSLFWGAEAAIPTFGGSNPAVGSSVPLPNPGTTTFCQMIKTAVGWLIGGGGLMAALVVVWAGFQMLTSAGDPKKAQDAKSTITYAVVGYAILLLSWGIISIVQQILGTNIITC